MEHSLIEKAKERVRKMRSDAARAVVFGLSGNPPTLNHLLFISHLMHLYSTVHVVLNRLSPLKKQGSEVDAEVRFEMLQAMMTAEKIDPTHCILERLEIDRSSPSYMIVTISTLILNSELDTKFTLALGLDCLVDFEKWYQWQRYGDVCDIKFYPRQGMHLSLQQMQNTLVAMMSNNIHVTLVYHSKEQKKIYDAILAAIRDVPAVTAKLTLVEEDIVITEGSSTALRHYYSTNNANNRVPPDIHPVVDAIIRKRRLYRAL